MMRSMYSGVAGLKTHQTKMDVIGNNIANVNTVAYKSQSVTFAELMYQTTQSASGPNNITGTGGVNARQIGLGVKASAINTNISSQGASQTTNNPFDIQITGDTFFIVSNGAENMFTRDGSFYVDGVGNLAMTSKGYNVMGWGVDPTTMTIKKDTVQPLRIMSPENLTYPPEATSKAYLSGIIDKNDTSVTSSSGKSVNLQLYDDLGYSYTARLNIKSTDAEGVYGLELNAILDENNEPIDISELTFGRSMNVKRETSLMLKDGYQWTASGFKNTNVNPEVEYTTQQIADAFAANPQVTDSGVIKDLMDAYGLESVEDFTNYTFDVVEYGTEKYSKENAMTLLDVILNNEVVIGTDANNNNAEVKVNAQTLLAAEKNKTLGVDSQLNAANRDDVIKMMESLTATGTTIDGYKIEYDPTTGVFSNVDGQDFIKLALSSLKVETPTGEQSKFSDIEIDFTATTMFNNSGSSTISATSGDKDGLGSGRKLGEMSGISIQQNGMIYASYDNGQTKLLGQIAVAEFSNASGLEKQGDNLYSATLNSGEFDGIGVDITASGGYMNTGVLEMSNVDLSAEFTEMITTQRGFQANSRIITVSDTLLEELVNLKR